MENVVLHGWRRKQNVRTAQVRRRLLADAMILEGATVAKLLSREWKGVVQDRVAEISKAMFKPRGYNV
eukprot:1297499-Heterocapsa_arctica.AAC.1